MKIGLFRKMKATEPFSDRNCILFVYELLERINCQTLYLALNFTM